MLKTAGAVLAAAVLCTGCLDLTGLIISKNAQAIKQNFRPEVNLFAADSRFTRKEFEIVPPAGGAPVPAELSLDGRLSGGVRFNVLTRGHLGQEFFYSTGIARVRHSESPSGVFLPYRIHNFGMNLLGYLRAEPAATRPFLGIGIGGTVYKRTPEARSLISDPARTELQNFGGSTQFAFNYGGGVKQRVFSRFSLRADLRHFIGKHPGFYVPGPANPIGDRPVSGAIHNLEASVGIILHRKQ
jgi:hypothetical protein